MKRLVCEMCGGTDLIKQDGVFVCQSCGMKYSVEEAKKMMVEGTVEVVGTVSVDKSGEIESLHKRMTQFLEEAAQAKASSDGRTSLELKKWSSATEYADRILDIDPENAPAYMGKFLQSMKLSSEEEIANCNECDLSSSEYLQKALRFADPPYRERLEGFVSEAQSKYRETVARLAPIRSALPKGRIATSRMTTVGVRANGTVVSFGVKYSGILNGWRDIIAVAAGEKHTVGLKADGTVVAACDGMDMIGLCNVGDWRDIIAVAAGEDHTVGLKADGTVVIAGALYKGQCNVGNWRDIVAVTADNNFTYGLKSDGTVVAVGGIGTIPENKSFTMYHDIVAVAPENVMLRADGRVIGRDWRDIVAVSSAYGIIAVLKADGTVVIDFYHRYTEEYTQRVSCEVGAWKDIVAISVNGNSIVGLKRDGTVVATGVEGRNAAQRDVDNWREMAVCGDDEFRENIRENTRKAAEAAEARQRQSDEWVAQGLCRHCGGQIAGLFAKKCKSCGR